MKIGVISDTHDQIGNIKRAVSILNHAEVELVVHCGDWVSPFTVNFLKKLKCPIKGVFGNNDGDKFRHLLLDDNSIQVHYEDRFLFLQAGDRNIAVWHGDYREITDALIDCRRYDAVFHGHTHRRENLMIGSTLSLNPGSFLNETSEQVKGASFAIYDSVSHTAEIINLD